MTPEIKACLENIKLQLDRCIARRNSGLKNWEIKILADVNKLLKQEATP